jgi:hypothetical protein
MDSVSADDCLTEGLQPQPMLGVVPARMNWLHTWDDGTEIVELYLDRARRDGCLVLCEHRAAEENVCTFSWAESGLQGTLWRGKATKRPAAWRERQRDRVTSYLAESLTDLSSRESGPP